MSLYLLDTDIMTLFQQGQATVVQHVLACPPAHIGTTVISVEEQLTGWYTKLRRAKKRDELARVYQRLTDAVRFVSRLQLVSFTKPAIVRFEQLRKVHRGIAGNDLRIAAIAIEQAAVLVTRNTKDFQAIPGLSLVDWSK